MPQPIERVKREAMRAKGGNFGCTSSYPLPSKRPYLIYIEFPVSMPARYGRKDGKAELGSFVFRGGGAFSDLRKGHQFPKIRKPTKWPSGGGAFSDQAEKKPTGSSDLNVSPPSDGLTKHRQCFSAAATCSGSARVQDRPPTWWKRH